MVSYVDIIGLCHSVAILCNAAKTSWEVATLPFQAHANYETCSVDVASNTNRKA